MRCGQPWVHSFHSSIGPGRRAQSDILRAMTRGIRLASQRGARSQGRANTQALRLLHDLCFASIRPLGSHLHCTGLAAQGSRIRLHRLVSMMGSLLPPLRNTTGPRQQSAILPAGAVKEHPKPNAQGTAAVKACSQPLEPLHPLLHWIRASPLYRSAHPCSSPQHSSAACPWVSPSATTAISLACLPSIVVAAISAAARQANETLHLEAGRTAKARAQQADRTW